jgi:hypothetical protein
MAFLAVSSCNNFSLSGILDNPPAGPGSLRLLPDAANVKTGTTLQFSASGGSGSYFFAVESGGAGGSINGTGLYTAPALPGTDTITVTDSAGTMYSSTAMVVPALPLALTPTSTSVNAHGSVVFAASGGSGVYSWTKVSGVGTQSGATFSADWTAGTATIRVTDTLTSDYREATITVNPPTAVQVSPSSTTLNAGQIISFTGSGGSGAYTWSKTGVGTLVGATYTAPWTGGGSATITVTDTNTGGTANAAVTVNLPAPLNINPKSTGVFTAGTVTFSAGGGSGTYTYALHSGSGSVIGATYTAPGFATVDIVRVTDTNTLQTDDATVTVTTVPVVLTISPKSITIDAGASTTLAAGGGILPYSYSRLSGGGALAGAVYTAPWAATTAVIRVTDSLLATDDATITVIAPPSLVVSPGTTTLNVGQNVTFSGSGGTGNPANYTYTKISGAGTLVGATYTAPGSATTAVIQLKDTLTLQTVNATVTVAPPPLLTVTPASANVFVGDAVTFTAGGGSGSYHFSLVSGTGSLVGPAYTTAAAETSTIRLLDTITLGTLDATVNSYYPVAITPSTVSVQVSSSYPFSASGGLPPYTYSVIAGTGTINPSTGVFTAPGGPETDTVKVVDSIGNATTASVTVQLPAGWNITAIDASARSGQYASLALDGSGTPRIAYYEGWTRELRLATWGGSAWSVQTVDNTTNNIGQYCSLALAPGNGYPCIAYYDAHNHDLRYASWNGSSWSRQTVASSGDVGKYSSLALEPGTGFPRISYYDETNDNLKYAWWNGSSWSFKTVDIPGSVGLNTSLALEPGTNQPRISYYDKTHKWLKYAYSNDGGANWTVQTPDSTGDVGLYSSLAIEPGTRYPRISYYDNTLHALKHASWDGSAWNKQTVDPGSGNDVGSHNSLVLEPGTSYPRISYYDATGRDLKYAWWNGATWTIEIVDTLNNVGSFTSLRLDPAAPYKPRIAYYDSTAQDLKYASRP